MRTSDPVDREEALETFLEALAAGDPEQRFDRAPCGYLTTTAAGLITEVNRTFLTLTGYRRADLVGRRRFVDLLTVGGRIYHETHYAPMLQMQGLAREIALELVRADGSRLPVLVNAVLERDGAGSPTVVRTAVFDATQRRAYERELLLAKQRAEESESRARALAHALQQTFLPPSNPSIPGLELAAGYRPAGEGDEIGGDFYDVFEVGPDDWCVVIGDVCGKGIEAAVVTALARNTLRAAAVRQPQPSGALAALNEVLLYQSGDRYCTVAVLRVRRRRTSWKATLSCGGHPLPYLVRSGVPVAVGRPGPLVGVFERASFTDTAVELGPEDAVVLYTDGVTEGRRPDGTFFGEVRLTASLREHGGSAASLADGLLDDVMAFQSERPRDDVALVAVAVPGRGDPAPG
ncbi:MAG: PP2C family protein-serine/threonine phosphatase [Acidimicrobiales bacterium]